MPDDDLTSEGTILGTLAYMPPEQERGEPVDPRADVYAIGAMLWELCTLQKLPHSSSNQRRRILRREGIDADLITIIDKAVDADRARRYPDAGELAADLKAFKAGARIAARRYSLPAALAHWTRRHRTLALSAAAAFALALAVGVTYVRNISAERDRADAARQTAQRDLERAQLALLLLEKDLTSAKALWRRGPSTLRNTYCSRVANQTRPAPASRFATRTSPRRRRHHRRNARVHRHDSVSSPARPRARARNCTARLALRPARDQVIRRDRDEHGRATPRGIPAHGCHRGLLVAGRGSTRSTSDLFHLTEDGPVLIARGIRSTPATIAC
jgi:hypothetical protein